MKEKKGSEVSSASSESQLNRERLEQARIIRNGIRKQKHARGHLER